MSDWLHIGLTGVGVGDGGVGASADLLPQPDKIVVAPTRTMLRAACFRRL